ncbi:MAG: hypothetical protein O4861_23415 [Trichodesmium sp. St16_bin4-tuft]|nr:hypothetical protein [Trichodesmium sp. St5_bin8]MDE5076863.1 hypothetical protein [Trichodesmium sp. St2_bin6]MDE5101119.1 hypothetical protein [Trichodesmium sp. St16_bin4-tuft]MDE5104475.1 hypothetical protein [Trichodesmium sp. St19_bin2]
MEMSIYLLSVVVERIKAIAYYEPNSTHKFIWHCNKIFNPIK